MLKFLYFTFITIFYTSFCYANEQLPETQSSAQSHDNMTLEKVFGDAQGSTLAPATVIPGLLSVVPQEMLSVIGIRGAAAALTTPPGAIIGAAAGVVTAAVIVDQELNDGKGAEAVKEKCNEIWDCTKKIANELLEIANTFASSEAALSEVDFDLVTNPVLEAIKNQGVEVRKEELEAINPPLKDEIYVPDIEEKIQGISEEIITKHTKKRVAEVELPVQIQHATPILSSIKNDTVQIQNFVDKFEYPLNFYNLSKAANTVMLNMIDMYTKRFDQYIMLMNKSSQLHNQYLNYLLSTGLNPKTTNNYAMFNLFYQPSIILYHIPQVKKIEFNINDLLNDINHIDTDDFKKHVVFGKTLLYQSYIQLWDPKEKEYPYFYSLDDIKEIENFINDKLALIPHLLDTNKIKEVIQKDSSNLIGIFSNIIYKIRSENYSLYINSLTELNDWYKYDYKKLGIYNKKYREIEKAYETINNSLSIWIRNISKIISLESGNSYYFKSELEKRIQDFEEHWNERSQAKIENHLNRKFDDVEYLINYRNKLADLFHQIFRDFESIEESQMLITDFIKTMFGVEFYNLPETQSIIEQNKVDYGIIYKYIIQKARADARRFALTGEYPNWGAIIDKEKHHSEQKKAETNESAKEFNNHVLSEKTGYLEFRDFINVRDENDYAENKLSAAIPINKQDEVEYFKTEIPFYEHRFIIRDKKMIFLVLPEEDFEIPDFSQPIKNPWTVVTVRPVQKNSSIDKGFIINDEVFNAYKLKYIKIDGDIEELPEEGEFDLEDIRQAAKAYQPSVLVGSTGRTEHRNLHENVAMLVAKATPHYGIQIDDNIPMIDTRWPVEEGWKKWEMRFFYDTTIENESEIVIQYVCNNDVCDDFKFKEETSKPNPPPVRPPVPPLDILSRDDEMASVEQDVPPAPYTGIWSEEDLSFLERVGRIKLKPYEKEFLIKEGYTVQQWEDSLKNKRCIFYLEGGPYFMVRTLATLCKKASDGQVDEAHHMPASDAIHPNMPGEKVYLHWLIGTSILMEKNDHLLTSSYGRLNESKLYRKLQRNLIESGQYRDAVNLDINDVRNNFGVKYDKGIQQMLRYLDLLESTGTVK